MTSEKFNKVCEDQIQRCTDLLGIKANEYATHDRLHSFKAAASMTRTTPKQALLGMWAKHLISVIDMVNSGKEYPMALWDEKITDTINYLLLLKALVIEESQQTPSL